MSRRSLPASLLIACALLLAACGGSSTPAPTPQGGGAPAASSGSAESGRSAPGASSAQAAASAVAPAAIAAARQPEIVKVTLGLGTIAAAPSFIALERGYWREEGIELEDISVGSGSTATTFPALAANQLEVATGGTTSGLFNAVAQGINVRIALDQTTATVGNDANGVLVRKELADSGRLRDPAGLRGLRVAFTGKGHNTQMLADAMLAQAGLSVQDVESLEMPYTDMNTAIANNNLDAAVSIEPFVTIAINAGYGARWKSWADVIPNDQVASVLYSAGFADDRTEVARRYAKGWVRAVRDYEAARTRGVDREEIIAILLRDTALKDRALYDTMPWVAINPNGRVSVEAITAAQDWFAANGYVPRKIDLGQVIDHQFADYAVRELGPYQP